MPKRGYFVWNLYEKLLSSGKNSAFWWGQIYMNKFLQFILMRMTSSSLEPRLRKPMNTEPLKITGTLKLTNYNNWGINFLTLKGKDMTYLKFFPESLFWFFWVVCYFVELSYPVFNVGCVYPCGIEGLPLLQRDKEIKYVYKGGQVFQYENNILM